MFSGITGGGGGGADFIAGGGGGARCPRRGLSASGSRSSSTSRCGSGSGSSSPANITTVSSSSSNTGGPEGTSRAPLGGGGMAGIGGAVIGGAVPHKLPASNKSFCFFKSSAIFFKPSMDVSMDMMPIGSSSSMFVIGSMTGARSRFCAPGGGGPMGIGGTNPGGNTGAASSTGSSAGGAPVSPPSPSPPSPRASVSSPFPKANGSFPRSFKKPNIFWNSSSAATICADSPVGATKIPPVVASNFVCGIPYACFVRTISTVVSAAKGQS